jgi:predicted nucleic acid-binding protein
MKVFCDTNVLIAAFLTNHPHHHAARPVLERIQAGRDEGWVAAHSLAECYAVLTRLPGANQVPSGTAWQLISENTVELFSVVSLGAKEYAATLEAAAAKNIEGGTIYDALLLTAASKSGAERIYTFKTSHFQRLADDVLRNRIISP